MTNAAMNLNDAPETVRPAIQTLATTLHDVAGNNLLGLTAYGAVLTEQFDPANMNVTSVAVLGKIDLNTLRSLAAQGLSLGKQRVTAPLVMTPDYIADSLDSFPLEFIEIHQNRLTVVGQDFFKDVAPQPEHVRLQCEREFKRILIRVRQGVLAAAGNEQTLGHLLADIGEHALRTIRGLLWLKGRTDFIPASAVLDTIEQLADHKYPGLRNIQRIGTLIDAAHVDDLYADIETLARESNELVATTS